jgi:DNA-binding NtrC family response regulator
MTEVIQDAAGEVVGPAKSIAEPGRIAKTGTFDVAVLDVNLADGEVTPVLESLHARKIPMLVYTGSSLPESVVRRHPDLTTLRKPVLPARLLGEIAKAHRNGRA